MITVYCDDVTVYNSRLDSRALEGLKVTTGLNKGGTAEITMPPNNPAYGSFISYRSIVEIFRDNERIFRGRALYPSDDFYGNRTITCEGERCFLRDAVMRPYLYQDSPAAIFADIIGIYNSQVEAAKSFAVGTVTVTDANNYIRIESESAEQVADTIDKLVDRCGGYIVFTTNADGQRVINWYDALGYQNNQVIEFGENLLDYSRTEASTDLATRIIPYGAKNEETSERVTIEEVNGGLDYVEDAAAVALRGVITKAVYWDDVTLPENLKVKAEQYLATSKMIITTLELSAVDLSVLNKDIDSLRVGDAIQVKSKPHSIDDTFLLRERTYDLLDPAQDKVVLGKDLTTLTGADVAGDRDNASELHRTKHIIKSDYTLGIAQAVAQAERTLSSLIDQTSKAIRLEVSETYATNGAVESLVSTSMTQLADSFNFEFTNLQKVVDENDAEARGRYETISKYIRFEAGNIILGERGNELVLRIENDRISFLDGGAEVAYFSNKQLYVTDGHFLNSLRVGKFAFVPRANGNLSLVKWTPPPLEIVAQPESVELRGGNGVHTFTIKATGEGLTYRWQQTQAANPTDEDWEDVGTERTYTTLLVLQNTDPDVVMEETLYVRCIITDGSGKSVTSDVATLHVTTEE